MQTFKQIPYQNYIQLKFNTRNLHEAQHQQAMIKYKRNSQLLAEIFSFNNTQKPSTDSTTPQPSETKITQSTLQHFRQQISQQNQSDTNECQRIKQSITLYEQTVKSINEVKSREELLTKVDTLKESGLCDQRHPFFAKGSPFYLNQTDAELLEVNEGEMEDEQWDNINLVELA